VRGHVQQHGLGIAIRRPRVVDITLLTVPGLAQLAPTGHPLSRVCVRHQRSARLVGTMRTMHEGGLTHEIDALGRAVQFSTFNTLGQRVETGEMDTCSRGVLLAADGKPVVD
jgi:hypothetical protein